MMPNGERFACSVCAEKLPRQLVHRNRAGAYICHACLAVQRDAGFLKRTLAHLKQRAYKLGMPVLMALTSLLVALAVAYLIIAVAA